MTGKKTQQEKSQETDESTNIDAQTKENNQDNNQSQNLQEKQGSQIVELTNMLQRLQADFENYKKRSDKEKDQFAKFANHKLIANMLPLLDSFEMAIKNSNAAESDKFKKGVQMIYNQLYNILQAEGLKPIKAVGEKFDPYKHEVLMQGESEQDEIILEEYQKGYMLNGAVLRHSKVKIGRKKQNTEPSQ